MAHSYGSTTSSFSSGYRDDPILITDLENFEIAVVESSRQVQVIDDRRRGSARVVEKTVAVFNIIVEDRKHILSLVRYIPDFVEFDSKIKTHYRKSRLVLPNLVDPYSDAPASDPLRSSKGENRKSGTFIKNFFSRQTFSSALANQKSNAEKVEEYLRKAATIHEIRNSSVFRDFLACQREEDASALKDVVQGYVQRQAVLAERQSEERAREQRASRENHRIEQQVDDDLAEIFNKEHDERFDPRRSLRVSESNALKTSTSSNRSSSSKRTITNRKDSRGLGRSSSNSPAPRLRKIEDAERNVRPAKVSIKDFQLIKVLGKGCMGKVLLVREHRTKRLLALKSISKEWVILQREIEHTKSERDILARVAEISHPFLVKLHYSFQSHSQLFLVLDYYVGGDIATQLAKFHRFEAERCRLYAAEIVLGIEELHRLGIVYRDLKPENILLTSDGHIVLTDFGLSKQFTPTLDDIESDQKTNTFCGTAEYLGPEILRAEDYSYAVDYWSLGTLLYEMITGITPFWAENHAEMYRRVLEDYLEFPEDFDHVAADFISGLLERNPELRLGGGVNGAKDVKSHPYFASLNWNDVYNKRYIPPYVPELASETDFSNFDDCFLTMTPRLSAPADAMMLTQSVQNVFEGYSFCEKGLLAQSKVDEEEEEDEDEYEEAEEGYSDLEEEEVEDEVEEEEEEVDDEEEYEDEEDYEDYEEEDDEYEDVRHLPATPQKPSKKRAAPMSFEDGFLRTVDQGAEQHLSASKRANNTYGENYEVRHDEEEEYVRLAKQAQLRAANEHAAQTPRKPKATRFVPDLDSSNSDSDSVDEEFVRFARSSGNKPPVAKVASYPTEERKRSTKRRNTVEEAGFDFSYEKQQSELFVLSQPSSRRHENYLEVESTPENSFDLTDERDEEYNTISDAGTPRQGNSYIDDARVPEYVEEPMYRPASSGKPKQVKRQPSSMSILFGGEGKKKQQSPQVVNKSPKKKLFAF